ncbi:H-NS histone family protein [Caballeronia sp. LjRoot34]|uniref:H-NS histone family protein n=1 Tax=Caballeronia sp. LjRoot34 TaxID=3342325 RepID=UPI003ECCDBE2
MVFLSRIETNCIKRRVPLMPSSITRFRNQRTHGIVRAITLKETIMPTLEQIQAKLKKLQAQAEVMIAKRAQSVLDDIRKLMEQHGLTTADIDAHSSTKKPRGRPAGKTSKRGAKVKAAAKPKLPAKYRNPKTGETWSGWARPPLWIKDVRDRTKFLIDGHSDSHALVASATKPASKKASKKVTVKKAVAKTLSAKAPAKKIAAKKASAKSATVANVPAKKAAAKKTPVKRVLAKKSATAASKTPAAGQDSASAVAVTPAV